MLIVEHHDNTITSEPSTFLELAGHTGTIEFPYQAEMWVQKMQGANTHRLYVHDFSTVWAVYAGMEGRVQYYVARSPEWPGEWQLPFLTDRRNIASAIFGPEKGQAHSLESAGLWADLALRDTSVATAVVLDADGILVAYENSPNGPVLVARGPGPLVFPAAA